MCIPGSLVGGLLCEKVGPRRLQLFLAPVLCVSLMVMHVASWESVQEAGAAEAVLLVSRIVQVRRELEQGLWEGESVLE